jgi:CHASE3 domain sensor protein
LSDEQVIKLLEEIRDLQKLHVENYKDALKNQQESIDLQRRAARRQKITLFVVGFILLALWIFVAWSSYSTPR